MTHIPRRRAIGACLAAVLVAALTLTVVNAGAATAADATEQIPDGTFDSGLPGQFSAYGTIGDASVVNGEFCASVDANRVNPWDAAIERKGLSVVAGESYQLKIKLNAAPTGKFTLVLQDLTSFNGGTSDNVTLTGAADRTYNFMAGISSNNMGLALQLGGFGNGERNAAPYTLCIDDVSLTGAAPPTIPDPDPNSVIVDSNFNDGTAGPASSYGGTQHVTDGRLCLDVPALPGNPYGAAVQFNGLTLVSGFNYALTFTARASIPVIVRTAVGRGNPPYETFLGAPTTLSPADTDVTFTGVDFTFPVSVTMTDGQIAFQLGGSAEPFTFCVDDVRFVANVPAAVYTPDTGPRVRVNQVGYLPKGPKGATLVTEATAALPWQVKDSHGHVVASGKTTPRGLDSSSQLNVHSIDFGKLTRSGTGFTLVADGQTSRPFDISTSLYQKLRTDALRLYYPQRSGEAILDSVQPGYALAAGHIGVAPNLGDTAVPCAGPKDGAGNYTGPPLCDYTLDVTGGWYDAGDHGKYVVNGGISVAQLMGTWERNRLAHDTDRRALKDSTLAVPERGNGVPDILDEARVELEWMLKMQVPAGQPKAGMAHHSVHDQMWTGLPLDPAADPQARELVPPTTAATLNLAAAAAQGARVFAPYDWRFALKLWAAAKVAWNAANANPTILQPGGGVGGGAYDDTTVTDEFYWAATELYLTTGEKQYRDAILASPLHTADVFGAGSFDWGYVAPLARIELATVPNLLPDRARVKDSVVKGADKYLATLNASAWALPYAPAGDNFVWGSNNVVLNNMVVMATAFDLTDKAKYRDGVIRGMDYLLGRNALNQSYVTGYGEVNSHNQHTRMYSHELNLSLPNPPVGSLAGGPNATAATTGDPVAVQKLQNCVPQFCYVDDIGSYSTNELTINWNSPLTWVASFLADQGDGS